MKAKIILQYAIGPIGAAALSSITLPFIAWFFSTEDVGRLTMLQVVVGLSVSLFSLAMHQSYVREYHEEKDKEALLKLSIIPGLVLLTSFTVFFSIAPFSISNILFGIESTILSCLLFVCVYSAFFINFLAHAIRMQERGLAFSATQITPKALLLLFISLIMLLSLAAEFKTLMLMNTLSVFLSFLVFSWLTRKTWIIAIDKTVNIILLKKMLAYSLPLVMGGMAYWGLTAMDRFFIRSLSGFQELGVYALAASLAGAVSVLTSIFSSLWHPTLYRWVKEGVDKNKIQCVIESMVLVVTLVWSLIGMFSFLIPLVLPKEYFAIEYLIIACVAMPLFYLLSETTGVGIGISRRSTFSMLASLIALLINAILNYLLIPIYGASGAALASVIAFFVFFTVKTEASALVWVSLPRFKIYVILIGYIGAAFTVVLTKSSINQFYLVWCGLAIISSLLFKERLWSSVSYIVFKVKGNK
ncbi:lipopolysaccharide biosynthesis protein [Pseudoalteromonas nigrifaciens]|uniref:lipopolysaccharide biosynthesis protein n=1 Tax=Pseudoalteromonas nigrifaciens TaxID=28109 RepID=UPI003FCFCE5E